MAQFNAPSNQVPPPALDDEALTVLASCAANLEEKLGAAFVVSTVSKTNGTLEFRGTAPGFQVVSVRVLAPAGEAPRVDAIIAAVLSPGADGTPALACNMMMGADCQPGSGCKF